MAWPLVARAGELPPGARRVVRQDGQEIALFNVEGRLYAVGNRCPHRGGPLVRGRIETVSGPRENMGTVPAGDCPHAVRCPIHGWLFDLATGQCLNQPQAAVPAYTVTCHGDQVCVQPVAKSVLGT